MNHSLNPNQPSEPIQAASELTAPPVLTASSLEGPPVSLDAALAPDPVLAFNVGTNFVVVGDHDRRYTTYLLGSAREYYSRGDFFRSCGHDTVAAALAESRLRNPNEAEVYAIQEAGVIVSDELAARGLRPTRPTVELKIGQVIEVEGRHWELFPTANRNLRFKEVEKPVAPVVATPLVVAPDEWLVPATTKISKQQVADLLSTASEGGINYWAEVLDYSVPPELPFRFDKSYVYKFVDYPLNGGAVTIGPLEEDGDGPWTLDGAAIERGLGVMANKYPRHWKSLIEDNADAETADVFVQCCLFGEIVYG